MKKKKSKSKRFKKVNGQLVEFRQPPSDYDECMTECRRVSPPHEDCETICLPYIRPRVRLDEECYQRCRHFGGSHGYCDHICLVPYY